MEGHYLPLFSYCGTYFPTPLTSISLLTPATLHSSHTTNLLSTPHHHTPKQLPFFLCITTFSLFHCIPFIFQIFLILKSLSHSSSSLTFKTFLNVYLAFFPFMHSLNFPSTTSSNGQPNLHSPLYKLSLPTIFLLHY